MSTHSVKNCLSDYTFKQFVRFIDEIRKEDIAPTDLRADALILHFNKIVGHPSGMDLIYYPEPGADATSSGIARTVMAWREANRLPGFKT